MRIGIATKPDDPRRVKIARHVHDYLAGKADLVVQPEVAKQFDGVNVAAQPIEDMRVDAIVAVGGDGTLLHTLQLNPAPIFGINVGELGFLTEIEPIELSDGLNRLLSGDYFVESRLKLSVTLNGKALPNATNEVVVKSKRVSKLVSFDLAWGEWDRLAIRADGLIVSTPTGSTSYAMSAGGPIVDPRVDGMIVVPLAAFSLASRPMVLPSTVDLAIRMLHREKEAIVVVDGQFEQDMSPDDELHVGASRERARFIRFRNQFMTRLRERLR
ncbi:MAG TPA: NAD(+)/NADH kinase [Candidatus Thermoplasmatota archaeon]|nr:NAD(+)/NADH kinase [Candidatus Thermoplasmatota archaeon]